MNTTELETLIRTILSEQLTPTQEKKRAAQRGIRHASRSYRRSTPGLPALSTVSLKNPQRHYWRYS
jgi:hypothetical protein